VAYFTKEGTTYAYVSLLPPNDAIAKNTRNFLAIPFFYPNNRYISSINPFVSLHNKLIEAGLLYFRHIDLLTKEE
jgi:hypothetical protein